MVCRHPLQVAPVGLDLLQQGADIDAVHNAMDSGNENKSASWAER